MLWHAYTDKTPHSAFEADTLAELEEKMVEWMADLERSPLWLNKVCMVDDDGHETTALNDHALRAMQRRLDYGREEGSQSFHGYNDARIGG